VESDAFDEVEFFRAIARSGARALLIGRRALIALGAPLLTRDYDFWIHIDDIDAFNRASGEFGLVPNRSAEQARQTGRYVLEDGETVDVLIARSVPTVDGRVVSFSDVWERRRSLSLGDGLELWLPEIDDLILTKRFGGRPRDAEDILWLEMLRARMPT
jgi:hypothetical protein